MLIDKLLQMPYRTIDILSEPDDTHMTVFSIQLIPKSTPLLMVRIRVISRREYGLAFL